MSQAEDKAALVFLKDLTKIGIEVEELVNCLEIVKCWKAVNFFQKGASMCPHQSTYFFFIFGAFFP